MWNPFSRGSRLNRRSNNGQASLVVPEERLGSLEDVAGEGTAPIVSVSVGSTGLNRARRYHRHMDALGAAGRIQSMLMYDCNQFNINKLKEDSAQGDIADKIVIPEYLPFSEGFLRRVDQYENHYSAIERDMENMVEKMEHLSLSAGTEPQIILEWIGFGGHAMLSYMFHDIVVKRFPEATILPIVCFPDDRGMHQNIRDHGIWEQTVEVFGEKATLLTDNRVATDYSRLDESLITALASVEGCFRYDPSSGSLAEVISVFNIAKYRWIVIQNSEIPVLNRKAMGRKAGRRSRDQENQRVALSKLAQKIKDRIFEIAQPENRFPKSAFFRPGGRENEQRIYVTMPLYEEEVKAIRDDLEDQLKREEFSKAFPGTQIAYAAGNPQTSTPENWEYVHVIKFIGLDEKPDPLSVSSIIKGEALPDEVRGQGHRSVKTRGQIIIDEFSMNGAASGKPADPPPDETTGAGPDHAETERTDKPDDHGSETAPDNTDTASPLAQREMHGSTDDVTDNSANDAVDSSADNAVDSSANDAVDGSANGAVDAVDVNAGQSDAAGEETPPEAAGEDDSGAYDLENPDGDTGYSIRD